MFCSFGDSSFLIDSNKCVWGLGNNSDGQLGIGDSVNRQEFVKSKDRIPFTFISGSSQYTIGIDTKSKAYITGKSPFGSWPFWEKLSILPEVETDFEVKIISSGKSHSIILDKNGDLWGIGSNSEGQLGFECQQQLKFVPVTFPQGNQIINISCGEDHSIFLDVLNCAWTFGGNGSGQLGRPCGNKYDHEPTLIENVQHILQIYAGNSYSCLLDANGDVWITGLADHIGLKNDCKIFVKKPELPFIIDVIGSPYFIVVKDEDDKYWVFGSCKLNNDSKDCITIPEMINTDLIIRLFKCGAHHGLILDAMNNIWGFGKDSQGNLGKPSKIMGIREINVPEDLELLISELSFNRKKSARK